MGPASDPFAHHPELRDKISDPLKSFYRTFTTEILAKKMKANGMPLGWWYSEDEREASRNSTLADRRNSDLWVFTYGSLMWDPGFRFEEVRRAHAPEYARRFILKDIYGGRGTLDAPGLMAALDKGPGCDGLAYRIRREDIDEETAILWRREKVGPAYLPVFIDTIAADDRIKALTFVADHDAKLIDASLTRAQQIEYFATGTGFMGTSLEYLQNIAKQFAALGIHDEDVTALLHETETYIRSQ